MSSTSRQHLTSIPGAPLERSALSTRQKGSVRCVSSGVLLLSLERLAEVGGEGSSGDGPLQVLRRAKLLLAPREVLLGLREGLADPALSDGAHDVSQGEKGVVTFALGPVAKFNRKLWLEMLKTKKLGSSVAPWNQNDIPSCFLSHIQDKIFFD